MLSAVRLSRVSAKVEGGRRNLPRREGGIASFPGDMHDRRGLKKQALSARATRLPLFRPHVSGIWPSFRSSPQPPSSYATSYCPKATMNNHLTTSRITRLTIRSVTIDSRAPSKLLIRLVSTCAIRARIVCAWHLHTAAKLNEECGLARWAQSTFTHWFRITGLGFNVDRQCCGCGYATRPRWSILCSILSTRRGAAMSVRPGVACNIHAGDNADLSVSLSETAGIAAVYPA